MGIKRSPKSIKEIIKMMNSDMEFDSEARILYYFNKEVDLPFTKLCEFSNIQGFSQNVRFQTLTENTILCIDSKEYELKYGDELEVKVCQPDQHLTSLKLAIDDLV